MRIKKIATTSFSVKDNPAFAFFQKAVPFVTWTNGGHKTFKHFKKQNEWDVLVTRRWGTIKSKQTGGRTPEFLVNIYIYEKPNTPSRYRVELFNNKKMTEIASWADGEEQSDVVYNGELKILTGKLGIADVILPNEVNSASQSQEQNLGLVPAFVDGKRAYNYVRLTKIQDMYSNAQSLEVWIAIVSTKKAILGEEEFQGITSSSKFNVFFRNNDVESGFHGTTLRADSDPLGLSAEQAKDLMGDLVAKALYNGFVDDKSPLYIPKDANQSNWDFRLNMRKSENIETQSSSELFLDKTSQSQDFGGYYSGNIPDPTAYVGTSAVEASQIKAVFGGSDKAIQYVNEFNSELLKNVAFVFNFSKAGAYGVYLSELDRAIKTKVLQRRLEQMGYKVVETNGMPEAFPTKEEKSTEQIKQDIESLYNDLNKGGGTAIGINMNNVLSSARSDLSSIPTTEPEFLFQQLAILHLGETIVHECVHAKGHHDEGPSEQAEAAFANWVLPKINQEYMNHLKSNGKEQEFNEIIIGTSKRHASSVNWYKMAQNYVMPPNVFSPNGSDLSGRMGGWHAGYNQGRQDWSMMFNQMSHESIEKRLGRQFMWPLARDINLEKDSIEEQLRKTFDREKDTSKGTEELLQKDRASESELYKSIEEKLKDTRPAPLLKILEKNASITKIATVFGWYNNLEISDGSTIPGLGDRVMAWDDRDEDFAWSDQDIRKQPRYNPEYDVKGFYYRWIEPRFAPQLFDDMTRDLVNTHPAKRFASADEPSDLDEINKIISLSKDRLGKGHNACRFIVSEDLIGYIANITGDVNTSLFEISQNPEPVYAMWIYTDDVEENSIEEAEAYFRGKSNDENSIKSLLGIKSPEDTLNSILQKLKEICENEQLDDIYLVGEPAREKIYGHPISSSTFRFCCESKDDASSYGQYLAKSLGLDYDYDNNGDLKLFINDMAFVFHSGENKEVCDKLISMGANPEHMDNGITCELSNKDFTINMIAYNVANNTLYDPFEVKDDIDNKIIRTRYDANEVIESNPMVILKAIKLMKEGFTPDDILYSIIENKVCLLKSIEGNALEIARMFVLKNGITDFGE